VEQTSPLDFGNFLHISSPVFPQCSPNEDSFFFFCEDEDEEEVLELRDVDEGGADDEDDDGEDDDGEDDGGEDDDEVGEEDDAEEGEGDESDESLCSGVGLGIIGTSFTLKAASNQSAFSLQPEQSPPNCR